MKKFLVGLVLGSILMLCITSYASQTFQLIKADFKVLVNGNELNTDLPIMQYNGSTYMPLRAISEAVGVKINWNNNLKRVEIGESPTVITTKKLVDLPETKIDEVTPLDKEDLEKLTSYQKKNLIFTIDSRQEMYDRLKKELQSRRTNFIICSGSSAFSGFTDYGTKNGELQENDIVDNMLKQIFQEDPYLSAITNYKYTYSAGEVDFTCSYLETLTDTAYVKAKVKQILENIIKPNMTDLEKEKIINQWICDNISYDNFLIKKSAYDALKSPYITVCSGYTLLAYEMLTQSGLKSEIVSGRALGDSLFNDSHTWNKVFIDNKWQHLDITWNDTSNQNIKYLNKSDAEMSKDHSWK